MAGNKYILMKEYNKAIAIFQEIIINSIDSNDYYKYAYLLVMLGESEKALEFLKKRESYLRNDICKFLMETVLESKNEIAAKNDKKGLIVFDIILGKKG